MALEGLTEAASFALSNIGVVVVDRASLGRPNVSIRLASTPACEEEEVNKPHCRTPVN